MKRAAVLVGALLVVLGVIPARAQESDATVEEVRQALARYREAVLKADTAELSRTWSDDYKFVNPRGEALTKAQRLENFSSGGTQLTAIEDSEQIEIRSLGDDAAVAMGRVRLEGKYSGQESTADYRSLMVWVKKDGRWQIVAAQLTPILR